MSTTYIKLKQHSLLHLQPFWAYDGQMSSVSDTYVVTAGRDVGVRGIE